MRILRRVTVSLVALLGGLAVPYALARQSHPHQICRHKHHHGVCKAVDSAKVCRLSWKCRPPPTTTSTSSTTTTPTTSTTASNTTTTSTGTTSTVTTSTGTTSTGTTSTSGSQALDGCGTPPLANVTSGGHSWTLEGTDDFTINAPTGSFASADGSQVVDKDDHGMGW